MLQMVDGREVYVVNLPPLAQLKMPIVGTGFEQPYAQALNQAIECGQISQAGQYGIEVIGTHYNVYAIQPPSPN